MAAPLVVRYTSRWPGFGTPGAELIYEGPQRQRQLLHLAERQLECERSVAQDISRSSLRGARLIGAELNQQTTVLSRTIEDLRTQLVTASQEGSFEVVAAIDDLRDQLCLSLDEIRWQLAQQRQTLEGILAALVNSRKNEAQQLVTQAVRLMINEEYGEAERCLLLALDFDRTDYQVLLNLAFVEIHKGNAVKAADFFQKALSRPGSLDRESRSRVLWALARLHYAGGDFGRALETAVTALSVADLQHAGALFTTSTYAALAGDRQQALDTLARAIEADRQLFSRAAVDPDLDVMKGDVRALLSAIASRSEDRARGAILTVRSDMKALEGREEVHHYSDILSQIEARVANAERALSTAGYTDCLNIATEQINIRAIVEESQGLADRYRQLSVVELQRAVLEKQLEAVQKRQGPLESEAPLKPVGCGVAFFLYLIPPLSAGITAFVMRGGDPKAFAMGCILGVIWPLTMIGTWIAGAGAHSRIPPQSEDYILLVIFPLGAFIGVMIVAVLLVVFRAIPAGRRNLAIQRNESRRAALSQVESPLRGVRTEARQLRERIDSQRSKIAGTLVRT